MRMFLGCIRREKDGRKVPDTDADKTSLKNWMWEKGM
jgi:hypothetical protein